jgi:Flp pilus assembly protein TadG
MRKLWPPSISAKFRAFRTDRAGVAAVEFALLVPVLLIMTFGTIELSRALIVHKRFQRTVSMVGDLVTREKQLWPEDEDTANVTTADAKASLAGIMKSVTHAMEPYSVTPLTLRVYQVWANLNEPTKTKIEWSYQYPSEATVGCGDDKTIDTGILVGNGRAVFIEAQYHYTPLLGNLLPSIMREMTWSDTMVMTPRDVPSVMFLPGLNNSNTWDNPSTAACE